jgi:hypothetical protein
MLKMSNEMLIWSETVVKLGIGRTKLLHTIPAFVWRDGGKLRIPSVEIIGNCIEIGTGKLSSKFPSSGI